MFGNIPASLRLSCLACRAPPNWAAAWHSARPSVALSSASTTLLATWAAGSRTTWARPELAKRGGYARSRVQEGRPAGAAAAPASACTGPHLLQMYIFSKQQEVAGLCMRPWWPKRSRAAHCCRHIQGAPLSPAPHVRPVQTLCANSPMLYSPGVPAAAAAFLCAG